MGALFGFAGAADPKLVQRMGDELAHRGRLLEKAGGPGWRFGLRRACEEELSIETDGAAAVALAGRLWDDDDGRSAMSLRSLLEGYRSGGASVLRRLRGEFVLALTDGRRLLLARDAVGGRSLFFARHEGRLLFAAEPKAITSLPGFPRRIRPAAVAQYFAFSFVPGEGTMLEGVREMPAGSCVEVELADAGGSDLPGPTLYHRFEENEGWGEDGIDENGWVERTRETIGRAVTERLPQGRDVAVFLSGGLDSSIVTAEVARRHDAGVKTYSIHFGEAYPNELPFARQVAEHCGTRHREVLIRPDAFLPRLRRIVWHLDDPIGDPITVPNFELARLVGGETPFVFNGEGGDPILGGPKNLPMLLQHWYGTPREPGFRERCYLASYRRGYEILSGLLTPEWRARIDPGRDLEAVLTPFFERPVPRAFLNKLMAINIRLKGAHLILPKVERMTAAAGLVPLMPLYDQRLVELSFAMPPRAKLYAGIEKRVLKEAYRAELPRSVLERPKSGMRVPVHFWFQREMRRYARSILRPRELRRAGIFDPAEVRRLLRYEGDGRPGRYGLRLWMILTFEIWRRIVVEREPV